MTNLRLSPAMSGDLSVYLGLLGEVDDWLDSKGIRRWESGSVRDFEAYFRESIDRGEVYLAFLENQLAGTLRLIPEDPVVWPEVAGREAMYLYNLAVRRSWAGRGLGRRMLDWAESKTSSMSRDYLRLDCFANNAFLCRYYADAGFADRGEVDARYPPPIGTLRLRRFEKRLRAPPATA